MKATNKERHVIGKPPTKQAAAVATQVKNDKWGQLGFLKAQHEPDTELDIGAAMRIFAQKDFARLGWGRRYAAELINRDYQQGDRAMYRVVQGACAPDSVWTGPAH
eukprot:8618500-Heterocapsa_arctica.AAC.1